MSYDNTNRGAIWPNDRMREGKEDPQFTGNINIEGVEYWLNGWRKKPDAKDGAPSMSFSVSRKDQNKAPRQDYQRQESENPAPFDDDLGF
jgi:hypothetical protein